MSDKPVTKIVGDEVEKYIETNTSLLTWLKEGSLIVACEGATDLDMEVSAGMGRKLMAACNMAPKLQKALLRSSEDNGWDKFKTVFHSTAKNLAAKITLKVSNDVLVGVVPQGFEIRNMKQVKKVFSAAFAADPKLNLMHEFYSHDDIVLVIEYKGVKTELDGQKYTAGVVFSYSTVGNYGPSFAPCLIPAQDNKKVSFALPTINDNLIFYPDSFSLLEEDDKFVGRTVKECADSACAMAARWDSQMDKALSVFEYERLMKAFLNQGDTTPEYQMLNRMAQIYEAHNITDGRPSKDWLKTAWSGTTVREFLNVAFDVPVDYTYRHTPIYEVATILESSFNLDSVANNRIKALEKLSWDGETSQSAEAA